MEKSKFYKKYLPAIVYGGSDGAISYFTLMAGAYGAGLSIKMLIAIGVSNIFADGFSMATADYLATDNNRNSKHDNLKSAIITFVAFCILGTLPLAPTFYSYYTLSEEALLPLDMFILSSLLTLLGFVYIGYIRGSVLKRNIKKTIMQSLIICSMSAVVAFYVGEWVAGLLR